MEFPSDILDIIKEYSMPITNADWRRCGKIRIGVLKSNFHQKTSEYEFALINSPVGRIGYNESKNKVFSFDRYYSLFKR